MLATLGTRSFSAAAPKFWNSPLVHIHDIQSLAAFKRLVKTFFQISFYMVLKYFFIFCILFNMLFFYYLYFYLFIGYIYHRSSFN